MIKQIFTKNAPEAIGCYSQAVQYDKLLFSSGQIPVNPENGDCARQLLQAVADIIDIRLVEGRIAVVHLFAGNRVTRRTGIFKCTLILPGGVQPEEAQDGQRQNHPEQDTVGQLVAQPFLQPLLAVEYREQPVARHRSQRPDQLEIAVAQGIHRQFVEQEHHQPPAQQNADAQQQQYQQIGIGGKVVEKTERFEHDPTDKRQVPETIAPCRDP